jgi:DMSO/TMAO reductase YedYZ molybdopterin-dependent catalytic subunit
MTRSGARADNRSSEGSCIVYSLRLRTSTTPGYKNAKWIKAIEVTNDYPRPIGANEASISLPGSRGNE